MRILLDTNVLARAASGPPSLANELVLAATRPQHSLLVSPFLVSELSRVLRYERLRAVHGLEEIGIDQYIADLQTVAEMVLVPGTPDAVVAADPQDDPVIALAVVGQADVLCTKDRHLFRSEVVAYCASHNVDVVTDLALMDRLRTT
jgi:putative PIN family toxin of toxin-antitoxin system